MNYCHILFKTKPQEKQNGSWVLWNHSDSQFLGPENGNWSVEWNFSHPGKCVRGETLDGFQSSVKPSSMKQRCWTQILSGASFSLLGFGLEGLQTPETEQAMVFQNGREISRGGSGHFACQQTCSCYPSFPASSSYSRQLGTACPVTPYNPFDFCLFWGHTWWSSGFTPHVGSGVTSGEA